MTQNQRSLAIITGANGGIGRATARALGTSMDLVLADLPSDSMIDFAETLRAEGFTVRRTLTGAVETEEFRASLVSLLANDKLGAIVHTAGLSSTMGDWRTILTINWLATERLLDAIEPYLQPRSVAILISSIAGHSVNPELVAVMTPLLNESATETAVEQLGEVILSRTGAQAGVLSGGLAYCVSKLGVMQSCQRRARKWGRMGARIMSISPGMIYTAMGQRAIVQNPTAQQRLDESPAGRWGTAMDIASVVKFLVSDDAAFLTGSDVLVDGGMVAAKRFAE
jgi:NAD(P)-dependent dehydrogenase (short-subunit alcohol dehydrogenase family)